MEYGVLREGSMVALKANPSCRPQSRRIIRTSRRVNGAYGGVGVAGGVIVTAEMLVLAPSLAAVLMVSYGSPLIPRGIGSVCWNRYESESWIL
jgi:hypothetical protein